MPSRVFVRLSLSVVLAAGAAPVLSQSTSPASGSAAEGPPPAEPSPTATPTRAPFVAGYKNGFALQSPDADFSLKITGYVHADGRFAVGDSAAAVTNQFLLRRARPIVQGTVGQYFDFVITPDFGGGTTVLQDGYLDTHFTNKLRFRVGKLKAPFGIERLQSAQAILFVERSLANNLVPNRDVGVQVHGELAGGALAYQAGVFDGVPDNGSVDVDTNDAKDVAGRLFLTPWKTKYTSPLRGIGFGIAGTQGKATGALRPYVAASQVSVFSYLTTVTSNGDRTRFSPQASVFVGPLGFIGEYVEAQHEVQNVVTGKPTTNARLKNTAFNVTGSFLLTGEEASYATVKPKNFFVPSAGKWGALQLVARYSQLKIDGATFDGGYADITKSVREASAWGVGLNWIWNNNVKYVVDYEQTSFKGGAAGGADRQSEKSVQTRLHLGF
jgi:phosphate-selective porin OprO and OprP